MPLLLISVTAVSKTPNKINDKYIDKAAVLVRYCNKAQVRRYGGPGILSLDYRMWEEKRNIRGFIMSIDLRKTDFQRVIEKLAKKSCI